MKIFQKCFFVCLLLSFSLVAADKETPAPTNSKTKTTESKAEADYIDLEHEETFMDVPDALRSKQFVHRAILSTLIRDTNKFRLGSLYFNHLLGFNAVYQPANRGGKSFAKYTSGSLGMAIGYSMISGHSIEAGAEVSALSNLMLGYRYIFVSEKFSFWPYLGGGFGFELSSLRLADLPVEAQAYQGKKDFFYATIGALVPIVDIGLKAEARFSFYGIDRLMLSTGVGVIFFI